MAISRVPTCRPVPSVPGCAALLAVMLVATATRAAAYEVFIDTGDGPLAELSDRARWADVADRIDGWMINGAALRGLAYNDALAIFRLPAARLAIAEFGLPADTPAANLTNPGWANIGVAEQAGLACPWLFGWDERNPDSVLSADQCRAFRARHPTRRLLSNSRSWPRDRAALVPLLQQGLLDGFVEEFQAGYGTPFFTSDVAAAARWAVENHKLFVMLIPPQDAAPGMDAHDYVSGVRELAAAIRDATGPALAQKDAIWFVVADYGFPVSRLPFLSDRLSATGYGNSLVGAAGWLLDHRALLARAKGGGLLGHYYNNGRFGGRPALRTDAAIAFDWGEGKPEPGTAKDNFTVRWTGTLEAGRSADYTLTIAADDEARVWIDRRLVIDTAPPQAAPSGSATLALRAGIPVDLVVEYRERAARAAVRLTWSSAGQEAAVIDAQFLTPGELPAPRVAAPTR